MEVSMDFFFIWVFPALILGGFGLFLFWATTKHINRCKTVAGWSKTNGTVDRATVEEHKSQRYNRTLRTGYRRTLYEPKIEYSYSVMGSIFHSGAYQNFNGVYHETSEEKAAEIVAAYPAGKSVTVTYDPNNPSDAYLLPETDTHRLVKNRSGQVVMLIIALVWFLTGSMINLSGIMSGKMAEKQIHASAALLPFTTEEINAKLDPLMAKYQLVCQDEKAAGQELKYYISACRMSSDDNFSALELYYRQEAPEKSDFLAAFHSSTNLEEAKIFLFEAAGIVFMDDELITVQDWIADNIQQVAASEGDVDFNISGIDLALDNLGGTVRLNIGDLQ
ncbi:MAG: hypothetical protein C0410_07740 [Anaerolinea sp.]|nr:hypothetical protein [Anaerolinea sp.]